MIPCRACAFYMDHIRNFCIIAHIDHGKSTLADRFIQKAKLVADRDFRDQILDTMDIERERGITIKSQAVSIPYRARDGKDYLLNLVDTPGHVDFSYEVSRSLSACEGAVLLVDATQGVEAQTLSNLYMAMDHNLEIIPVINKIDLPSAEVENVRQQIERELGLDGDSALLVSGKTGAGVDELFEAIVERVPPPTESHDGGLKALIFDSHYDPYRGVIVHLRVMGGEVRPGQSIRLWSTSAVHKVEQTGIFRIGLIPVERLGAGEVGYITAGIKTIADIRVGDTVTSESNPCLAPLPGFRDVKPVVFSSIYPVDSNDLELLSESLQKLKLNDASLVFERDSSIALGAGFRCGFLGLLHLEIVQERLEREFDLSVVFTAPSVRYRLTLASGEVHYIDNPASYPDPSYIARAEEPYISATVISPNSYLGSIIPLCLEKRGVQRNLRYLDEKRVEIELEFPLAEVIFDFYDRLKSVSRGYASFDYEIGDYRDTKLVKLEILINSKPVDALSQLVFADNAYARARSICERLREEIPRHQFKIAIQGAIGGTIIARETINPVRKDVTAKCYGGDITRKRKLLDKQKEGKKKLKEVGNVRLPQSAFLSVLRTSDSD
jgi:GTP-binding protein LepA